VALGYDSVADEANVISIGNAGRKRRLVNLAGGVSDTDAVNVLQLRSVVGWFGGGADFANGAFSAPTFSIQGTDYSTVADAFAAIDGWMTSNANGVQYDDDSHATVTLDGADGTQVKNLADGMDAADAVNKGQMDAGDDATLQAANAYADAGDAAALAESKSYTDTASAQTLQSANAYTDSKFEAWNDQFVQFQNQVDKRFAQTDRRIDRIGAMGSAMTHMAVNAANGSSAKGRFAIGVGAQGNQGAVSIGYGKRVGSRGSFTVGGSYSGGETSAGAGFGFDL
jgi:autotransporter adhesin